MLGDFVAGDGPLPGRAGRGLAPQPGARSTRSRRSPTASAQVLVLRYGLDDDEPKTLEEIGRRLGLTRERVRQIEVEALRRLASLREMQAVPLLRRRLVVAR